MSLTIATFDLQFCLQLQQLLLEQRDMSFYKNKSTVFQLPSPICWYKIISNPLLYLLVNMKNVERCCCVCGREGIYLNLFLSMRFFEISAGLTPHKAEFRTCRLKVSRLQMKAFLSAGFLFVNRIRQKQFLSGPKRSIFVEKDITSY